MVNMLIMQYHSEFELQSHYNVVANILFLYKNGFGVK